jgi:hypothetical protein
VRKHWLVLGVLLRFGCVVALGFVTFGYRDWILVGCLMRIGCLLDVSLD